MHAPESLLRSPVPPTAPRQGVDRVERAVSLLSALIGGFGAHVDPERVKGFLESMGRSEVSLLLSVLRDSESAVPNKLPIAFPEIDAVIRRKIAG